MSLKFELTSKQHAEVVVEEGDWPLAGACTRADRLEGWSPKRDHVPIR